MWQRDRGTDSHPHKSHRGREGKRVGGGSEFTGVPTEDQRTHPRALFGCNKFAVVRWWLAGGSALSVCKTQELLAGLQAGWLLGCTLVFSWHGLECREEQIQPTEKTGVFQNSIKWMEGGERTVSLQWHCWVWRQRKNARNVSRLFWILSFQFKNHGLTSSVLLSWEEDNKSEPSSQCSHLNNNRE